MHSYNWALENITEKLRKRNVDQGKLEDSDIENEIDLFKMFLKSLKALMKSVHELSALIKCGKKEYR